MYSPLRIFNRFFPFVQLIKTSEPNDIPNIRSFRTHLAGLHRSFLFWWLWIYLALMEISEMTHLPCYCLGTKLKAHLFKKSAPLLHLSDDETPPIRFHAWKRCYLGSIGVWAVDRWNPRVLPGQRHRGPTSMHVLLPNLVIKEGARGIILLWVKPKPTWFPTKIICIPVDNTPLHAMPSLRCPWGRMQFLLLRHKPKSSVVKNEHTATLSHWW